MAKVTVTNLTKSRIGVPEPINKTLTPRQSLTINLASSDLLDRGDKITGLIDAGLISVTTEEDNLVDDSLETPIGLDSVATAFGEWTTLTLENGWVDDGTSFGFFPPQFRTDGEVVQLRGFIRAPADLSGTNNLAFQLPVAARPEEFVNFIVGVTTNPGGATAFTIGQVSPPDDSNPGYFQALDRTLTTDWHLLDGISFSLKS